MSDIQKIRIKAQLIWNVTLQLSQYWYNLIRTIYNRQIVIVGDQPAVPPMLESKEEPKPVQVKPEPPTPRLMPNTGIYAPEHFQTEVSEDRIRHVAISTGSPNFQRLLMSGQEFKNAGLEPIYLSNKDESIIRVAARETWNKKLH